MFLAGLVVDRIIRRRFWTLIFVFIFVRFFISEFRLTGCFGLAPVSFLFVSAVFAEFF
jgi:hypothetical protein